MEIKFFIFGCKQCIIEQYLQQQQQWLVASLLKYHSCFWTSDLTIRYKIPFSDESLMSGWLDNAETPITGSS